MNRRRFVTSAASGATLAAAAAAPAAKPALIELRYWRLRNGPDNQRARITEWLTAKFMPRLLKAGVTQCGLFSASVGEDQPHILQLNAYPEWAAFEQVSQKVLADEEFMRETTAWTSQPGLPYLRSEVRLFAGFEGFPQIEVPPTEPKRPPRLFELRTYESNHLFSLRKKIGMFENGEIDIFRKSGITPVFFGRAVAAPAMPNLTYMVCYDSLAARETAWRAFGSSPEWAKLRNTPGLSDAEIVSNISSALYSPLSGSGIR
jgi:hypothetical protein